MKVVENEIFWLSKILSKSKFVFYFWTQSQKVPGTTIKTSKYVQKFFSLAFAMVWPFLIPWFKEIFEFFQKIKLVISDVFRGVLIYWAYCYLQNKLPYRDCNTHCSSILKCWWSLEWFTMEEVYFSYLKINFT